MGLGLHHRAIARRAAELTAEQLTSEQSRHLHRLLAQLDGIYELREAAVIREHQVLDELDSLVSTISVG